MTQPTGRHELKHYINYADYLQLRCRLPHVACLDYNAGPVGTYRVRSLYFDNYTDQALRQKVDGVNGREKFRIRVYNSNPGYIRLEKKSKKNSVSFKQKAPLTVAECNALVAGQWGLLRQNSHTLAQELYAKLHTQVLRPCNIVDYQREAYVYPAGNVRVTIDSDIRTSTAIQSFLNPELIAMPIPKVFILEVKYDNYLPELIRGVVALSSRRSTAFSKYAAARTL